MQATQLRMMAESFRVENGSSTADALIGSYNAIEQHQDSIVLMPKNGKEIILRPLLLLTRLSTN